MAKRRPANSPPPSVLPLKPAPERLFPAIGWWKHPAVIVALLLLISASFSNSFYSGMTLDNRYIIEEYYRSISHSSPDLDLHSRRQISTIFFNDYWFPKGISGLYRPLTVLSYWFDYAVINERAPKHDADFNAMVDRSGQPIAPATYSAMTWQQYADAPGLLPTFSYHAINLLIHWLNASLVYFVCLALFRRFWPAAVAAGLFATHPIVTESVTNIIGRADLFAGSAILGGLLIHMAAMRSAGLRRLSWLTLLLLVSLAGVFCKESSGAVVFVIIAYDVVYRLADRLGQVDWREILLAAARACTITPLIFFGMCVFLLVLTPWMGQLADVDTHYVVAPSTPASDPGPGKVRLDQATPEQATTLFLANADVGAKALSSALSGKGSATTTIDRNVKICRTNDTSHWALYHANGTIDSTAAYSTLKLSYITGNGAFTEGNPVTVTFVDSYFPWAMTAAACGMALLFASVILLAQKNLWVIAGSLAAAVLILIGLGLQYHPRPEEVSSGPGQLLFRLHLVPSPSTPEAISAIAKALEANQSNPIVRAVCSVSLNGLWISAFLFVAVEIAFRQFWPLEQIEKEKTRSWKGLFDSYFVLLAVTVVLFVTRDWVFAGATPAEEPFLDNPIRGIYSVESLGLPSFTEQLRLHPVPGLSLIECKLTAVKVMAKLIGLLAWPWTLSSDYSYSQVPNFSWHLSRLGDWETLFAVALFVALGVLTWRLWKRRQRAAVFWIAFFAFAALPTSNFFYAIGSIMAERFMYVPLAGFAALFALAGFALADYFGTRTGETIAAPRLAAAGFAVICCIYGTRTFFRNRVWQNDVTLWRDAIKHSPDSFRCYQSLAFALYETDTQKYLDEMIDLDRKGKTIVDPLPDHLNSARMYLHLGMYLSIKGESELTRKPDGSVVINDAARPYYQEAVDTLRKGSAVDRAFDEMIRRRQQLRGDSPDKIGDMGLAPIYGTLAVAQGRLGHIQDALNSIQYQRQLDPADVDSYRREVMVCLDAGRLDQAAIALIQAILIDNNEAQYWGTLSQIYTRIPGGENAVVRVGDQSRLNVQNPLMRQHLIAAYTRFVRDFRRAHRPDLARFAHDSGINQFGLPAGLLDPVLSEPIEVCTPDGIQAGEFDSSVLPTP